MKNVILCLLFCAAVIIAPFVVDNHGYVFISAGGYTIETSLLIMVLAILIVYAVIALILKLVAKAFNIRRSLKNFLGNKRESTAKENLYFGLIALLEHRYEEAQHLLISCTHTKHRSVASYIIAAEAAAKNGNEELCLKSLAKARDLEPRSDLACTLLESGMYAREGLYDKAITVLEKASEIYPFHPAVYRNLGDLYLIRNDYDHLREILPRIKNIRAFRYEDFLKIQLTLYRHDLECTNDAGEVMNMWQSVTRSFKKEPKIKGVFARRMAKLGLISESEEVLQEGLRKANLNAMLDEICLCDISLPSIRNYLVLLEASNKRDDCDEVKLYRALANQFLAASDYSSSIDRFRKAIAIAPITDDYVKISRCYEAERLFEKASINLKKAVG